MNRAWCFRISGAFLATAALSGPSGADAAVSRGFTGDLGLAPFPSLSLDRSESLANALRVFAREGRVKRVRELLAAGAKPNQGGEFGETALYYAARFNHTKAVEALLERNANPDQADDLDRTPLMAAAMNCSNQSVPRLLAAGANVNRFDRAGRTALMFAAESGCDVVVGLLLKARGIDAGARDHSGRTAHDLAIEESRVEVGGPYTRIAQALRAATGLNAQPQARALESAPPAP